MKTVAVGVMLCLTLLGTGCGGQAGGPDAGGDAGMDAGTDGGQQQAVTVTGVVVDSDGTPVPNARVEFHSEPVVTVTGPDGSFSVEVAAGTHRLEVSKYEDTFHASDIDIPPGDSHDLGTITPSEEYHYHRLAIRQSGYLGDRFDGYNFWALVTVEDRAGKPVTGLGLDDFGVSEAMVERASGQAVGEGTIDLPAQVADDWTEAGLFEKSLGPGKLDIVLIMDGTGSMSDFTAGIIDQLHRLVDMLQAGHHDFRMAMLHTDQTPDGMFKFRFYDGNTERDRLLADIDYWFVRTGGEWWSPTVNYDAILASPWYRFRPEARKVVLVLTDIVPGTVYGTFWYPISCTNVTATAVELFAAEQGVEIYYSRNPSPHPNAEDYCQPDMNPRACPGGNEQWGITGSGLGDLAWPGGGSAVQLDWPLDAADVYGKLTGGDQQLADSQYLLTWESNFDLYDPVSLPGHEEEYRVEVTLAVSDPELPGELLDNVFSAPIKVPSYTLDFVMQDEEGNAATADDLRADLFFDVAGRLFEREHSLMGDETGLVTLTGVVAGRYRLVFQDSSRYGYSVENLRARDELQFDMPAADHSLEPFRVTTGEHLSDRYKLLGLLQDLDDWHLSGDPFARFAAAAREWLAELESSGGGLSWREQIAVKRLIVAVSGYANLAEYAQFESQLAVRDFRDMIDQIAAVIDQIKQLRAGLDLDWKQQIVAGMLKVIYGVLTEGRFNAVLEAVQHGLTALINYAASEAFDDTIDLVLDKFEELGAPGQAGAYVRILVKLVKEIASDNDAAAKRAALWEAAREMGLRVALDATAALVKDQVVDRAFAELELDTPLQRSLKALVLELVDAAFSENGFDDFDQRLDDWAQQVGVILLEENRDDILAAIDDIFDRLNSALRGKIPESGRDFVLGFLHDMALANVPVVKGNRIVHKFDRGQVIESLVRHGVYNIILKQLYVDEMRRGLFAALAGARAWAVREPDAGTGRGDWAHEMSNDFFDYRDLVGPMQQEAWNALALQDALLGWAQGLEGLVQILEPLSSALDVVAEVYPPLQQTAENVHGFIAVLDGLQVVATAVQFGLKVKCLRTFGNQAEQLYLPAF